MDKLQEDVLSVESKVHLAHLVITSGAFKNGEVIPCKYTFEGENVNPELDIANLPMGVSSLVLIVDALDNTGKIWTHWLVWNIPPVNHIFEASVPGVQGLNDFWEHNYEGPCAPKGFQRYFFRVYGLSQLLVLPSSANRAQLENAMKSHVLACGQITGQYSWSKT